jgi:hypothetical protein
MRPIDRSGAGHEREIGRFEGCMNHRLQVVRALRRGWRLLRDRRSKLALGIELSV